MKSRVDEIEGNITVFVIKQKRVLGINSLLSKIKSYIHDIRKKGNI